MASEAAAKQAMEHGMKYVDVTVKGPGAGREAAIRAICRIRSYINQRRNSSSSQWMSPT